MYRVNVSFTDYLGKSQRKTVTFNLDMREVFKMLPELKSVFEWLEMNKEAEVRDLDTAEVVEFYNKLESIILEAYGEVSEDGVHFHKGDRFNFEESATFNAVMMMFVNQPQEAVKLIEGLLPKEMFEMVKNADDAQLAAATQSKVEEQAAEIARLRAQVESQ